MDITNPLDLQRALRSTDNTFNQKNMLGTDDIPKLKNTLDDDLLSKMQDIAEQPDAPSETNSMKKIDFDFEENDDNSFFLDGDAYMQASSNIRADGSLPDFIFSPEENPYAEIIDETNDASLQDLIKAVEQKRLEGPNEEQAKAMHDEIFAVEEAFTKQSKAFLEGLGGDAAAAQNAKSQRRNEQFKKEQSKYQNGLNQELDEWQDVLDQQQSERQQQRQQNASSFPQERTTAQRQEQLDATEAPSEWVAVDDPSTGEHFYWNAKSGEMKWDLGEEGTSR
jgi:hypothetical protein